jgi:predicted porin
MTTLLGSVVFMSLTAGPVLANDMDDLRAYVDARLKEIEKAQKDIAKAQADLAIRADAVTKAEADLKMQAAAANSAIPATPANTPLALQTDQNGNALGILSKPVMLYDDSTTAVHLYGIIEATLSDASNQLKVNNANQTGSKYASAIGFQTAWFSGNRLGFDADHALDFGDKIGLPGLKAIMKLESEFESPTGAMDTPNVIFNRDAWFGFYSQDLGKLTFGRQNTLTRDFTQNWGDSYGTPDVVLKEGGYSNVNNFKQFIFYSADPGGTRNDSSVIWKKKFGDHFVAGLGYGFSYAGIGGSSASNGGALPGQNADGSSQAVSLAYNNLAVGGGVFNLNVNYDRANNDNLVHQAELIGGNYVIGMFRINAGYVHYTAEQGNHNDMGLRTDNSWTVSAGVTPIEKVEFDLGYTDMTGRHAGFSAGGNTLLPFLQDTRNVTSVANGSKGTLFGSVMFHADKQTDLYVASDYMKVHGGWIVGDAQGNGASYGAGQAHRDEMEVATGVRFKF